MPPSQPVTARFSALRADVRPLLLAAALVVAPSCSASDSGDVGDPVGEGDPGDDPGAGGGDAARELSACYFAEDAVYCGPVDDDARVRVEDFYPSACIDADHDRDRVPDFMEIDDPGGDYDDEHRCRSCNRGPGGGGDFRFETDGVEARLDRGLVYAYDGELDSLIVPTPGGEALTIMISSDTRVDDGYPAPGSEIRAEGEIDVDGVLWAERVKVLCDAPDALSPDDVPPDSEAVDPQE